MTFTILWASVDRSLLWHPCLVSLRLLAHCFEAMTQRPFSFTAVPHWIRAFGAWTDLNVIDFRGSNAARSLIVETEFYYKDMQGNTIPNRYKFDVLVTTYEMVSIKRPYLGLKVSLTSSSYRLQLELHCFVTCTGEQPCSTRLTD